jgi:predicted Zn-dependent peptidase
MFIIGCTISTAFFFIFGELMIHRFYKTQSKLATILVGFEAGSKLEHKHKFNLGVAHALEHNIFKHYNGLKSVEVSKKVSYLGGSINAYTSSNYVAYYIELPVEHIDEGMKIIKGLVSDVIVDGDDFSKEMEIIKEEEIAGRDSLSGYMWNNFSSMYFSNHLASPVIGTQETISKITIEELQDFHKRFCSFDKAIICMSANLTKKSAMKKMRDTFGKQTGRISRTKMSQSKYLPSREETITRSDLEHTFVWMGMPNKSDEDFSVEAYLINSMLSRGMDSRLYDEIREKRGLVYSVSSGFSDFKYGHMNMFNFQTREKNKDQVISLINKEISKIQRSGFEEDEIIRAKNKARSSFYRQSETSSGMAHSYFDSIVSETPELEEFMNRINMLNNDDLIYAANSMFDTDKCLTLICKGDN